MLGCLAALLLVRRFEGGFRLIELVDHLSKICGICWLAALRLGHSGFWPCEVLWSGDTLLGCSADGDLERRGKFALCSMAAV